MNADTPASILLVDDGDLDPVARLLEALGHPFERMRGRNLPSEIPPPTHLLIATLAHVERVRRGSPRDATPGLPLRVVAVDDDSPSMRRRLRRSGLDLLIRMPTTEAVWRLLIARALYQGDERRTEPRVPVGAPVAVAGSAASITQGESMTTLVDLSNRGCRLHTTGSMSIDQALAFTIPAVGEDLPADAKPLMLRGRVRRIVKASGADGQMIAMTFDPDLPNAARTRLTRLINRWASGTDCYRGAERSDVPAIPACRLPSIPDLTLDDETDPPVRARSQLVIELEPQGERRRGQRAQFESGVVAQGSTGPVVLIGRDLSPGGMRVEAVGDLALGDQFRLALHGPEPTDPVIVHAEVVRDDGVHGFALAFRDVDTESDRQIQKIVACLPDIESLDDSETDELDEFGGIGAILSELIPG